MQRFGLIALSACLCAVFCWGCGEGSEAPRNKTETANTSSQPTADDLARIRAMNNSSGTAAATNADGSLPPGHPPIGAANNQTPPMPDMGMRDKPTPLVKYDVPQDWVQEQPSSVMRVDQYRLPHKEGDDASDGELAVFGSGIGGTADENISRWRGQFTTADGKPGAERECEA